jgi:predicted dehydrogenase
MTRKSTVRFAVVGLGHIAQVAVLPAFANAENAELAGLVSDDPEKLSVLSERYDVSRTASLENFETLLKDAAIDAVYIALPDSLHREYTVRAARVGAHVLCEKPMAPTVRECEAMIRAAERARVKLMIAYRLHFEEANLSSIEIARSGRLGELRLFNSLHTQLVEPENQRLQSETSRGPMYDMGVYGINAARYLFHEEPHAVSCIHFRGNDPRFSEVPESSCAVLEFSEGKAAVVTASFGVTDVSTFRLCGTRGDLRLDPAFSYARDLEQTITIDGDSEKTTFPRRDQFAAELIYFSDCILQDKTPEPSGVEGLADVRILEALDRSAKGGKIVEVKRTAKKARPSMSQNIERPPVEEPDLVNAESPKERKAG